MPYKKIKKPLKAVLAIVITLGMVLSGVLPAFAGTDDFSVNVDIPLKHVVKGDKFDGNFTSTFTLEAQGDDTPMPEGSVNGIKSISVNKNGKASFGVINYIRPDVYEYKITRQITYERVKGLKTDSAEYKVSAVILADGSSSMIIKKLGDEGKADEIVFADTFKDKKKENKIINKIKQTGDDFPVAKVLYVFGLSVFVALIIIPKLRKKKSAE